MTTSERVRRVVDPAGFFRLERLSRWSREHPFLGDSVFAVAISGPLAVWSLYDIITAQPPWDLTLRAAISVSLAILVGSVAFVFRRTAPAASFSVVSAALLVQTIAPRSYGVLPMLLVFPFALFSFSAYGRRWAPALGLAVSLIGAGVLTAEVTLNQPPGQGDVPLFALYGTSLAVALVGWSLGLFRRVQLAYIAALEERAARAEAEREERARAAVRDERTRIAHEMHDVIAHSLAVIVSQAQGGIYAARSDPERAAPVLATIADTGRQALSDMRGLLDVLRPDAPANSVNDSGNSWAPQPALADLPELLERVRGAGLPVTYNGSGVARRLGPAAELAIYRLVQEALTNTLKHAGPGVEARVCFAWGEQALTVDVRDNGRGVASSLGEGHGLIGMRERLASVGGSVTAGPLAEGGFKVEARLPWHTEGGMGAGV